MTKSDQSRLRILILLLIALGLTVFISSRLSRRPNPAVVQAENQKAAPVAPVQAEARIRLDLLDKESANRELGKKNLFQYGPPPAPPAPPPGTETSTPPPPQTLPGAVTARPVVPPGPPPPPPIPLKFIGFAFVEPNSKALIATLSDDAQRHFNFVEGDVYQGRYRILKITDTSVEVEDLEVPRRQMLPLVKQ